ncbi:uncharacterized protein JCM6883_002916 [Sporobolomyces salmoneus]|uniref:uncharacterized protein n=1 Tax=Sporobolomyces salmoneus TaxID=183962 RepID=UPI00316DEE97
MSTTLPPSLRSRRQSQTPLLGETSTSTFRIRTRWPKVLAGTMATVWAVSYLGGEVTGVPEIELLRKQVFGEGFSSICETRGGFTPLSLEDEQRRLTIRIQPFGEGTAASFLPENTILRDSFHPVLSSQISSLFENSSDYSYSAQPPLDTSQSCLIPSTHSLPLLPKSKVTAASPEIFFSVSTSPDRAVIYAPIWKHFMSKPEFIEGDSLQAPGCLVTDAHGQGNHGGMAQANAEFRRQRLSCTMQESSRVGERYEMRVLGLVRDAWIESERRRWQENAPLVDWFVFADDDTWFSDGAMLREMLSGFDSREDHYFGAFSETKGTVESFGRISFGGAGITLSRGLVRKMQSTLDRCAERFADVFGGDGILSNCAAFTRDMPLENLVEEIPSMRQMDIRGDATGYLTSGRAPFMSLHHWASWLSLIPGRKPLPSITLFSRAASILGGSNFLRRFIFDSGSVEVVLGYAVTLYREPLQDGDLGATEHSWDGHESYLPLRRRMEPGKEKLTYYISSIDRLSDNLAIFHHTCNSPTLSSSSLKTFSILYDARSDKASWSTNRHNPGWARASPRSSFDRKQLGQKRIFHA